MRITSQALRDWQIGVVLQYQSGALIQVPNSNNALFQQLNLGGGLFSGASTYYNFAGGSNNGNFFTVNPNDVGKTLDPTVALVGNKSTWVDSPAGTYAATAAYYNNYRWQRQPSENFNFGRNFRMGKEGKMNLQVRAEFQNIFNRHFYSTPSLTNAAQVTANTNPGGTLSQGFGYVNVLNGAGSRPRTGMLVGRFTF